MGTSNHLASHGKPFLRYAISLFIFSMLRPEFALPAFYQPRSFFLSILASHDAVQPSTLNGDFATDSPLTSLISFRLRAERGLLAPSLTHWIDFGFGFSHASGQGDIPIGFRNLEQFYTQFYGIPAGITWWVLRTSFVDLGPSLGLGMGFLGSLRQTALASPNGAPEVSAYQNATIGPAIDLSLQTRFWFSKYVGADLSGGVRYFGAPFERDGHRSAWMNLLSYHVTVGATLAFGGVRGTGRAQVEILNKTDAKKSSPLTPSPSPPKARQTTSQR